MENEQRPKAYYAAIPSIVEQILSILGALLGAVCWIGTCIGWQAPSWIVAAAAFWALSISGATRFSFLLAQEKRKNDYAGY